jgi:hypothetical protein
MDPALSNARVRVTPLIKQQRTFRMHLARGEIFTERNHCFADLRQVSRTEARGTARFDGGFSCAWQSASSWS